MRHSENCKKSLRRTIGSCVRLVQARLTSQRNIIVSHSQPVRVLILNFALLR